MGEVRGDLRKFTSVGYRPYLPCCNIESTQYLLTYLFTYSVALVHKQSIPTERPPLVNEVSANVWG
jgi:hypothetical protein